MAGGQTPAAVWYEVVFSKVLVKKSPNKDAPSWGWVTRGQKVQTHAEVRFDDEGREWVELTFLELLRSCRPDDHLGRGFCLIDGTTLRLGLLLQGPLPAAEVGHLEADMATWAAQLEASLAAPAEKSPATSGWRDSRCIGEGLWRSGPLRAAPECRFFPRVGFVALPLTGGTQVYLLGGQHGGRFFNDVWLLRLSADAAAWMELSPHREPTRGEEALNSAVLTKWPGRERFGAAVGTVKPGRMALFVCGGRHGHGYPQDVWASDDSGSSWYCMCQDAPFGCRLDAGLVLVPGRHEQLVLCGGWSHARDLQLVGDIWISSDAGMHWQQLTNPVAWRPRGAPLMAFLPGSRRLLIMGGTGCQVEGAGMCERMLSNSGMNERQLSDAWEVEVDILAGEASWRALGSNDANDPEGADGFCTRTAAWDHTSQMALRSPSGYWQEAGAITALRQGRQLAQALPTAPGEWAPADLSCDLPSLEEFQSLALVSAPRVACPRLFLFTTAGVFASTAGEVRRQRSFVEQVGRSLDAQGLLPVALWEDRVAPALLMRRPKRGA